MLDIWVLHHYMGSLWLMPNLPDHLRTRLRPLVGKLEYTQKDEKLILQAWDVMMPLRKAVGGWKHDNWGKKAETVVED